MDAHSQAAASIRRQDDSLFGSLQMREARAVLAVTLRLDEPWLLGDHVRWSGAVAGARHDSLAQDELAARALADRVYASYGMAATYFGLFEPALIEAGHRWERAEMHVMQEHYVTDCTLRLMGDFVRSAPQEAPSPRTFLALCAENERHDVGLRMIADQLRVNGWKIVYFGADVPSDECPAAVRDNEPTVVGLSVTMTAHLERAADAIAGIRRADPEVAVVVGGLPFQECTDLWEKVGAHAGSTNGTEAVATIERLGDEHVRSRAKV
jgi:MerR family transcriptional regulator, light-induced transcriptional regulator